jgi:hypothetical protein
MNKRNNLRQRSALRTTLKLTLVAAVVAASGLVVLLIIVFNLAKQEDGKAQTAMTYRSAICIQDTSRLLRGSINQKIIGVVVETSGKGRPVKLGSMTFSARGTSSPISRNVENARLWYTSGSPEFNLSNQVGNTVLNVSEKDFVIPCQMELLPGKNYFWLTMDVKPEADANSAAVDAACHELRIGAISFKPMVADPAGKRFLEANIPFFSMGNLALGKVASWNSKRDGTGLTPRSLHDTRNSYFIQSGHRMISSSGSNLQTLVIEKGGELKIISPLKLNTMNVACGGVLQNDFENNEYMAFNYFNLSNGSLYIHNNKGLLPGYNCSFEPASSVTYFDYSAGSFRPDITYGHLIIDAANTNAPDLSGRITSIAGDFELRRAGSASLHFSDKQNLQIGGNLVLAGGSLIGSTSGNWTCSVGKDFIIKGGSFCDASSEKASTMLEITGDILLLNGNLKLNQSSKSRLQITGNDESRWIQRNTCMVSLGNVEVMSGKVLSLKGNSFGELSQGATLTVSEGASLMCGQTVVSGPGTFILEEKGSIGIGHPDGIWSQGAKGNVQTGKRVFNSGAIYLYYTGSQPQQTGIFSTTPIENQIYRLVVNKDFPTQAVMLSQNLNISDQCRISLGDVRENGFRLTLPGNNSTGLN